MTWRKLPQKISQRRIYVRLVEGGPIRAQIAQRFNHAFGEPLKELNGFRRQERAPGFKPQGIGEMVKGNEGPEAARAQSLKHGSIAAEGFSVPAVLFGLDP